MQERAARAQGLMRHAARVPQHTGPPPPSPSRPPGASRQAALLRAGRSGATHEGSSILRVNGGRFHSTCVHVVPPPLLPCPALSCSYPPPPPPAPHLADQHLEAALKQQRPPPPAVHESHPDKCSSHVHAACAKIDAGRHVTAQLNHGKQRSSQSEQAFCAQGHAGGVHTQRQVFTRIPPPQPGALHTYDDGI